MGTALAGDNPKNSNDKEGCDDLTILQGIGPARQKWLRQTLGVCTYQDLVALSADEIETRLKAARQVVSRSEIESWIGQARELMAEQPSQMELAEADAEGEAAVPPAQASRSPRLVAAARVATAEIANSSPEGGEWQPFASFVVEFQARQVRDRGAERRTTVHHMEADTNEAWSGVERERLCQWILDQLGEEAQRGPEPEEGPPVEARPAAAPSVTVDIIHIQVFQPPQSETPIGIARASQPFSDLVRSGEPFALEVSFALAGPAAAAVAKKQVTYRAQFYARHRSTGERPHLGDTAPEALDERELVYTARLPQASLGPGLYRLLALVTLQSTPPSMGQLEMPLLRVA